MRKRGANLNSPEASFVFGGPDQEQAYRSPDGELLPYDRATAAVDHITSPDKSVAASKIIPERDAAVSQIDKSIPAAPEIEADRKRVADKLNQIYPPENS